MFSTNKTFLSLLYLLFFFLFVLFICTFVSCFKIKTTLFISFLGTRSHSVLEDIYAFASVFQSESVTTALVYSQEEQDGACG